MRLALLVLPFLLLSSVGCARGSETVVLDWQGSEEGYAMALEAADEWATVCGAAIVVGRGNGGAPVTEVEGFVDAVPGQTGVTQEGARGTAAYVILTRYEGEPECVRHEFGHALGIVDHAPRGLMQAKRHTGEHVTPYECALLPR